MIEGMSADLPVSEHELADRNTRGPQGYPKGIVEGSTLIR